VSVARRSQAAPPLPDVTVDAFLGGKVEAVQPAKGHHRSGLEAVFLGASVDAGVAGTLVDLGAGAGIAGFCAAVRCPNAKAVLIEREPVLLDAANRSLTRAANSGFAERVRIVAADLSEPKAIEAERGTADIVIANPPFNPSATMDVSPSAGRAGAHVQTDTTLAAWVAAALMLLKPQGRLTMIFRADDLADLLGAMSKTFGALDVLPIHPRAVEPAHRVLVSGVKASRAPLRLLPPLVLHGDAGNSFRPEIDEILREGRGLAEIVPTWQNRHRAPSSNGTVAG
jgi:tRNA1(Val) A37 N6-methylase TrmN6